MCEQKELRKPAGLSGLLDTVRYVPVSQEGALWEYPVVSSQLLRAWAWGLGSGLPDGKSACVSLLVWQVPPGRDLCIVHAVLPPRGLPSGEANLHRPQGVSVSWAEAPGFREGLGSH